VLAGGFYERASGAAGQPLAGYRRRTPERTVLHELVAQHAQTMLAELRDEDPEGGGLPRYVEREPPLTSSAASSPTDFAASSARRATTRSSSRFRASRAASARAVQRGAWRTRPPT
jgi:hypothetical protein